MSNPKKSKTLNFDEPTGRFSPTKQPNINTLQFDVKDAKPPDSRSSSAKNRNNSSKSESKSSPKTAVTNGQNKSKGKNKILKSSYNRGVINDNILQGHFPI